MTFAAVKDPDATLDYAVDWAPYLDNDTIESVLWTVPTGLSLTAQSNDDTVATVWLSGGTVGTTFKVVCRITTLAGRIDDRTLKLTIKEK